MVDDPEIEKMQSMMSSFHSLTLLDKIGDFPVGFFFFMLVNSRWMSEPFRHLAERREGWAINRMCGLLLGYREEEAQKLSAGGTLVISCGGQPLKDPPVAPTSWYSCPMYSPPLGVDWIE